MLAEIFLIRMEAILRASKESAPAANSRFVPITLANVQGLLDKAAPGVSTSRETTARKQQAQKSSANMTR